MKPQARIFYDRPILQPLLLLFILALTTDIALAQSPADTTKVLIETADGNEFIGTILVRDSSFLKLRTEKFGDVTVKRSDVKRLTVIGPGHVRKGSYWFDNPQATRYFWAPNGYGLKRGEAYYQNVWVMFNQFSVGLTDNFSMGLGFVPLFLFAGASTPVWITPKFSVPITKDKFNVGVGGLFGTTTGGSGEKGSGFGIAYGMTTIGSRDKNLTLGLGYGYSGGRWATTPTFTLGGMIRTGRHGYLITENYFIGTAKDPLVIFSLGGRRIIKRVGLDFGLFVPFSSGQDFIAIPWLGVTVPLGGKK